jgi:hypothetical protein
MRVKKDKAYVIVSLNKGYVQGAFPYSEEGKKQAKEYLKKLSKKDKQAYEIKLV